MAYDFDGVDDSVERAQPWSVAAPLTIAAWFRPDAISVVKNIVQVAAEPVGGASGTTGNPSLSLRLSSAGLVQATAAVNNGFSASLSATAASVSTWHHGVAKFVTTSSRFAYIDGVSGTDAGGTRSPANLDNLLIGRGSGGTYSLSSPWNGQIAEVGVWDVALSDDEIVALAKGLRPSLVRPSSLLAYVPLVREAIDHKHGTMTVSGATVIEHPRRIA